MLVKVPVRSGNLCCLCPSNTTLALCRFNAGSTAGSPQSPLIGGEESQGSPQLRGIKGCHSLLSGPLTLSPYLNLEQHKHYCVRESLKRLHSLSLRAGGGGSLWSAKPRWRFETVVWVLSTPIYLYLCSAVCLLIIRNTTLGSWQTEAERK